MRMPVLEKTRLDDMGDPERFCIRCEEWWPKTHEFFFRANKGSGDGFHQYCRACSYEWSKAKRARFTEVLEVAK